MAYKNSKFENEDANAPLERLRRNFFNSRLLLGTGVARDIN